MHEVVDDGGARVRGRRPQQLHVGRPGGRVRRHLQLFTGAMPSNNKYIRFSFNSLPTLESLDWLFFSVVVAVPCLLLVLFLSQSPPVYNS